MTLYAYQKHVSTLQLLNSLLEIDGYNLIRADHPNNTKRGGVCIYYKESLPVRVISLPI